MLSYTLQKIFTLTRNSFLSIYDHIHRLSETGAPPPTLRRLGRVLASTCCSPTTLDPLGTNAGRASAIPAPVDVPEIPLSLMPS